MANPFTQIRTAAVEAVGVVSGVSDAGGYAGETDETLLHLAARRSGRAWVQVVAGERDADNGARVDSLTLVHFLVGCGSVRKPLTPQQAAEELLWDVLSAMQTSRLGLTWIFPLQYRDWQIRAQTAQAVILSLIMATRFDMAEWTE